MSTMYRLGSNDFVKGLVMAVFTAVITVLYATFTSVGFNLFTADWGNILMVSVNVGLIAFVSYLGKNFVSDQTGKVFGRLG